MDTLLPGRWRHYLISGYVALFEIENRELVTLLAVRRQREEDYYRGIGVVSCGVRL